MLRMQSHTGTILATLPLICALASTAGAASHRPDPLFLTASNGTANFLAVINTRTGETDYVPTGGAGGATGNAGGVAVQGTLAAAVNFGSSSVTVFARRGDTMQPIQTIKTTSQPVSVAFGHGHLMVLGVTTAESYAVFGETITTTADGVVPLLKSDKSAAQIVSFDGGVLYAEKSGSVAELAIAPGVIGAGLTGPNKAVTPPAAPNNDTPFGMIARGANVYLTIAHSNLEALVVNGQIVSMTAGVTPFKDTAGNITHAPCWNTLAGHFLYSADSPGKQLLRYLVSDSNIFFDKAGVAKFAGSPTDLAADQNLLGVIDGGDGTTSNASLFDIDAEGELTLRLAVKIAAPINGAAIIR